MEHVGRARKKLTAAIDGLRNNLQNSTIATEEEFELDEKLTEENSCFYRITRHGFPYDPSCFAFDPIQKLCAIGAKYGCVRILGKAGVDHHLKHESDEPVIFMQFLINEGGLVTVLDDNSIHLWNFRQKVPEIVHSLRLNRERVSTLYLPLQSRWAYIGTDKGNTYLICLATFELSSYVINWNKAVDLSCKVHPGSIQILSICPSEQSKLLVVFKKAVILWNLVTRESERFGTSETSPVLCLSWHSDGKQFMCGHADGSLTIWSLKKPAELINKTTPHSPVDSKTECRPIVHLIWSTNTENEQLIVFAGGMPVDEGPLPSLTVLRGKGSLTVLEMDHSIIDVLPLFTSPYPILAHPSAIAVLLKNDLLVVDMQVQGHPCFETPYSFDLHESSPVTSLRYFSDCPVDLIAALTLVGRNQRRQGVFFSERSWPISGGISRECATGYQELILTGHEDGSIKFWQASGEQLQEMYMLKTGRHFERNPSCSQQIGEGTDRHSQTGKVLNHSVAFMELCLESRLLAVAGISGQVTLFRFAKAETSQEITVVVIPISTRLNHSTPSSPPQSPSAQQNARHNPSNSHVNEISANREPVASRESQSTTTSFGSLVFETMPIKVRSGSIRRPAGYQPDLVCLNPWHNGQPDQVTAIALNSAFGILAIGTSTGLSLVDVQNALPICSWLNSELCDRDSTLCLTPSDNSQRNTDTSPSDLVSPTVQKRSPKFSSSKPAPIMRLNTTDACLTCRPPLTKAFTFNSTALPSISAPADNQLLNSDELNGTVDGGEPTTTANNVHELSERGSVNQPVGTPAATSTLSRTSSLSTGENSVAAITLMNCYIKRGSEKEPCLWVGLTTGHILVLSLTLPSDRITNQVTAGPISEITKLSGQILCMAFMDQNFCLECGPSDSFHDLKEPTSSSSASERTSENRNRVLTKPVSAPNVRKKQDGSNARQLSSDVSQVLIGVAENEAKVLGMPQCLKMFHQTFDVPIVKAKTSHLRGSPILLSLTAAGAVLVSTLPSLKSLFQAQIFTFSIDVDDPIREKFDTSEYSLGLYMTSPSEIQKFTVSAELAAQFEEYSGELFVPCDTPEPPNKRWGGLGGLSSLFTGGIIGGSRHSENVDYDAIFGVRPSTMTAASMRTVAKPIQILTQPTIITNSENAQRGTVSAGQALNLALQNLGERGERLGAVADVTESLRNNAATLQSRTSKLVEKYEKKKWYQF